MFVYDISDILNVAISVIVILAMATIGISTWWRQWRCKHDGRINETQACDAICDKCGKNLGFIGAPLEKHPPL